MFYPDNFDYVVALLIGVFGLLLGSAQANALRMNRALSIIFVITVFALGYLRFWNDVDQDVDSVGYYIRSLYGEPFDIGTSFVPFFTRLFTQVLDLTYFTTTAVYCLSTILTVQLFFMAFMRVGGQYLGTLWQAAFVVLVMTSVGFWGSAISKDSFVFLGVAMCCWAFTKPTGRIWLICAGVLLVTLVRPHIAALLIAAVGIATLFGRDGRLTDRLLAAILGVVATIILVPVIINYIGFGELESIEELTTHVEAYNTSFENTAGYVDLTELSFPMQVLTYLFRPFPWEAGSALQLAAAAQNMMLMAAVLLTATSLFRRTAHLRSSQQLFFLIFALLGLVLLAMTSANLGITTRQKWTIVLPMLLALVHSWASAKAPSLLRKAEQRARIKAARAGHTIPVAQRHPQSVRRA